MCAERDMDEEKFRVVTELPNRLVTVGSSSFGPTLEI